MSLTSFGRYSEVVIQVISQILSVIFWTGHLWPTYGLLDVWILLHCNCIRPQNVRTSHELEALLYGLSQKSNFFDDSACMFHYRSSTRFFFYQLWSSPCGQVHATPEDYMQCRFQPCMARVMAMKDMFRDEWLPLAILPAWGRVWFAIFDSYIYLSLVIQVHTAWISLGDSFTEQVFKCGLCRETIYTFCCSEPRFMWDGLLYQ